MKSFLGAGTSQDLFPLRVSARVAALRRHRRRQRLRSWAVPLMVFAVGAWVALVAVAGLGH
jgi:hypothetical protein